MKKISLYLIFLLLPFLTFSNELFGTVLDLKGRVELSENNIDFEPIKKDTLLFENYWIYTGFKSKITFKFDDAVISLGSLSRVKIKKAIDNEKNISFRIALEMGKANIKLNKSHEIKNELAADSRDITVYAVGTEFSIDANNHVELKEGKINIYNYKDFDRNSDFFLSGVVDKQSSPIKVFKQMESAELPPPPPPEFENERKKDNPPPPPPPSDMLRGEALPPYEDRNGKY